MEERKLTFREKLGVFSAIIMFLSIGMIMGGSSVGNHTLLYIGSFIFTIGGLVAVWLIVDSKKREDDELFM